MLPSTYDTSCQVEDHEHNLWIGTDGDGIYKVDPNGNITTFKKEQNNSFSNKIICMHVDAQNRIWIGTYLDGFGYYQNNCFHQQPFSDKFPRNPVNNSIWSITEDNKGNLYLGNLNVACIYLILKQDIFTHLLHKIPVLSIRIS